MARPAEFESATSASGGQRSIQLSYGRIGLRIIPVLPKRVYNAGFGLPGGFPAR